MTTLNLSALRKRTLEIDYLHKHRHLASSLSALPIIAHIYETLDPARDTFILSKGHACAAHYAVLEALGYHPDVSKVHPERDPVNGLTITSGSLGHGLPIAVGLALGNRLSARGGHVHVLCGDGELQEGTTWEALHFAYRFGLDDLITVHVDANGRSGCGPIDSRLVLAAADLFPIRVWGPEHAAFPPLLRAHPDWIVHEITDDEFPILSAELSSMEKLKT